jgi:hypothetical protein
MKKKINFVDDNNLSITDEYYTSAMVEMNHLKKKEKVEIKASEPIQVRINGGEWVDIRSIEEA